MDSRILQFSSLEGIGLVEFGYVHATGLPFQFSSEGGEGLVWHTGKLQRPDSRKGYWTFLNKASLVVVVTTCGEVWIRQECHHNEAKTVGRPFGSGISMIKNEAKLLQSLCPNGYSSSMLADLEPRLKAGQEGFWLDIPVNKLLARVRNPLAFLEKKVAKPASTN